MAPMLDRVLNLPCAMSAPHATGNTASGPQETVVSYSKGASWTHVRGPSTCEYPTCELELYLETKAQAK